MVMKPRRNALVVSLPFKVSLTERPNSRGCGTDSSAIYCSKNSTNEESTWRVRQRPSGGIKGEQLSCMERREPYSPPQPPKHEKHTFHPAVTSAFYYSNSTLTTIEYGRRDKRMHNDEGLDRCYLRNSDLRQTLVMGLVSGDLRWNKRD